MRPVKLQTARSFTYFFLAVATLYILRWNLMTVRFEWDARKNRTNIAKHGVGFEEASKVFSDPHVSSVRTGWSRANNACTRSVM
jgi:hypothetical protein